MDDVSNDFGAFPERDDQITDNEIVQEANEKVQIRNLISFVITLVAMMTLKSFGLGNHWGVFVIAGCWLIAWLLWIGPELLKVIRYSRKVRGTE